MKTMRLILCCTMAAMFLFGNSSSARAGQKADMRVPYVLQNLGVKRDIQAKLKPLLVSYLADKKAASKEYDDMKSRLKPSIEAGTITEKQANALLNAKWLADEKELAVKRLYETKFKTVLSAKKTYLCFDLLNDKKSKMMGKDNAKDDLDD
ncbi:MAG: hypothetical protein J6Y39_00285 [Bacteroidaceae bacterium]|nr:hypothetical protein [Bacteroidaceae bacterium]